MRPQSATDYKRGMCEASWGRGLRRRTSIAIEHIHSSKGTPPPSKPKGSEVRTLEVQEKSEYSKKAKTRKELTRKQQKQQRKEKFWSQQGDNVNRNWGLIRWRREEETPRLYSMTAVSVFSLHQPVWLMIQDSPSLPLALTIYFSAHRPDCQHLHSIYAFIQPKGFLQLQRLGLLQHRGAGRCRGIHIQAQLFLRDD